MASIAQLPRLVNISIYMVLAYPELCSLNKEQRTLDNKNEDKNNINQIF